MSDKSSIEWVAGPDGEQGSTWNPIRARNRETGHLGWYCEHVSEGCRNCYAEQRNKGFFQLGTRLEYQPKSRAKVEIFLDEKTLEQPLHWKKPRRIFPCSMTDWAGSWVHDEWIDQMFVIAALCPQHTFLFLTKRAQRMRDYLSNMGTSYLKMPLSNVHLGVSVEDQKTADERIPWLLKTPAAVRWVSYEPALGSVDFRGGLAGPEDCYEYGTGIDWLVIGGESGPGARPFDIQWAYNAIAQCKAAEVACFIKQLGRQPYDGDTECHEDSSIHLKDKKGGDWNEWPSDLRVRQYPSQRRG